MFPLILGTQPGQNVFREMVTLASARNLQARCVISGRVLRTLTLYKTFISETLYQGFFYCLIRVKISSTPSTQTCVWHDAD